jgi:imidazole glycerol phosphate synthase subunit HisF
VDCSFGGKVPTENLFDWAKEVEQRGAGEIYLPRWIMTELKWF